MVAKRIHFMGKIHIIWGKNVRSDMSLARDAVLELEKYNKGLALILS